MNDVCVTYAFDEYELSFSLSKTSLDISEWQGNCASHSFKVEHSRSVVLTGGAWTIEKVESFLSNYVAGESFPNDVKHKSFGYSFECGRFMFFTESGTRIPDETAWNKK
jgi:hypothetical protein